MGVLLDTCVISEIRRPDGNARVRRAVASIPEHDVFVSVLTVGEIRHGIALLRESRRKAALRAWIETVEAEYADRILPVDLAVCRVWADVTADAQKVGRTIPAVDGLIAATAKLHGFDVMTRNVEDFRASGVGLMNPWD